MKQKNNNINIILTIPHGRSGSMLLHSLFDSHPEIISFPVIYDWFNFSLNSLINNSNYEIIDEFIDKNEKIFSSKKNNFIALGTSNIHDYSYDNEFINIDTKELKENFLSITKGKSIKNEKDFFEYIHLALALNMNYDLSKIKYIFVHVHMYTEKTKYILDFLMKNYSNLYFLPLIRDPRESWLGWGKVLKKRNFSINTHNLLKYILNLQHAYNELAKLIDSNYIRNILFIDLNQLHKKEQKGLESLCSYLNINFDNCLLYSTFLNKLWGGNDSNNTILHSISKERSYFKWNEELNKEDKELINYYLSNYISSVNYLVKKTNNFNKKFILFKYFIDIRLKPLGKKDINRIKSINSKQQIQNNFYKKLPINFSKKLIKISMFKNRNFSYFKEKYSMNIVTIISNNNSDFKLNTRNIKYYQDL